MPKGTSGLVQSGLTSSQDLTGFGQGEAIVGDFFDFCWQILWLTILSWRMFVRQYCSRERPAPSFLSPQVSGRHRNKQRSVCGATFSGCRYLSKGQPHLHWQWLQPLPKMLLLVLQWHSSKEEENRPKRTWRPIKNLSQRRRRMLPWPSPLRSNDYTVPVPPLSF